MFLFNKCPIISSSATFGHISDREVDELMSLLGMLSRIIFFLIICLGSTVVYASEAKDEKLLGLWGSDEGCFVHIFESRSDGLIGAAWGARRESGQLSLQFRDARAFSWLRKTKQSAFGDHGERDPSRTGTFIVDLYDRNVLHSNLSPCFLKKGSSPRWNRVDRFNVDEFPQWYRAMIVVGGEDVQNSNQVSSEPEKKELGKVIESAVSVSETAASREGFASLPDGCVDLISIEIENREFIDKGVKYRELKNAIIQQSLIDAVQQTLGTEVRSNSGLSLSSVDGIDNESFNELIAQRANGLVKSYDVIQEDIKTIGNLTMLEITVGAVVCVPDQAKSFDMVAVGDFIVEEGQKSERLRSILFAIFPDQNENFRLVPGHSSSVYHDVHVNGKVLRVDIAKDSLLEAEKEQSQTQLNSAIFGGIVGAVTGMPSLGHSLLSQSARSVIPTVTMTVEVEVAAIQIMDQKIISERVVLSESDISQDSDMFAIQNSLLTTAVEQAADSVYLRLLVDRPNDRPSSGDAEISKNSKSSKNSLGSFLNRVKEENKVKLWKSDSTNQ